MENYTDLPVMHDTAIIAACLLCLFAGAIVTAIYFWAKRLDASGLTYIETTERSFGVEHHMRNWLFAGLLIALLTAAWNATDDDDRIARSALRDPRLSVALKNLRCPKPDAPLEKMLVAVGTQADGKTPELFCTYVTTGYGFVPNIRTIKSASAQ